MTGETIRVKPIRSHEERQRMALRKIGDLAVFGIHSAVGHQLDTPKQIWHVVQSVEVDADVKARGQ